MGLCTPFVICSYGVTGWTSILFLVMGNVSLLAPGICTSDDLEESWKTCRTLSYSHISDCLRTGILSLWRPRLSTLNFCFRMHKQHVSSILNIQTEYSCASLGLHARVCGCVGEGCKHACAYFHLCTCALVFVVLLKQLMARDKMGERKEGKAVTNTPVCLYGLSAWSITMD